MFLLISLLIFSCVVLAALSIYLTVTRTQNVVTARLEMIDPSLAVIENNPMTVMAERGAEPLNRIVPISAVEAEKLQKQLLLAGYPSPDAAMTYRAIQLVLVFAFPTIAITGCFLSTCHSGYLSWSLIGVALGFYIPKLTLANIISNRQRRITWALADALDLLVVTVEAGLGLNAALNRVGEELKGTHPHLYHELDLVNLEIRVGRTREEALRNLAERTGVDDIRSFVALLIQADRFGSSIARAVRVFADSLRTKRRQRAEQAAQKAALKLLIPTLALPAIIAVTCTSDSQFDRRLLGNAAKDNSMRKQTLLSSSLTLVLSGPVIFRSVATAGY
jgi:tight adherence protein C